FNQPGHVRPLTRGRWVVKGYLEDNGNAAAQNQVSFRYANALVDKYGAGYLGFTDLWMVDEVRGRTVQQTFDVSTTSMTRLDGQDGGVDVYCNLGAVTREMETMGVTAGVNRTREINTQYDC